MYGLTRNRKLTIETTFYLILLIAFAKVKASTENLNFSLKNSNIQSFHEFISINIYSGLHSSIKNDKRRMQRLNPRNLIFRRIPSTNLRYNNSKKKCPVSKSFPKSHWRKNLKNKKIRINLKKKKKHWKCWFLHWLI